MKCPILISYYMCINNGVGIIIYPQLRNASDPWGGIIWDGRSVAGNRYYTTIGNRAIVNLSSTGIQPGAVFLISSNTVWGTDMFDETQEFKYEPSANMIAIGSRSGPVNHGGLEVARHKAIRQPHGTVAAPREVPVGDNQL